METSQEGLSLGLEKGSRAYVACESLSHVFDEASDLWGSLEGSLGHASRKASKGSLDHALVSCLTVTIPRIPKDRLVNIIAVSLHTLLYCTLDC